MRHHQTYITLDMADHKVHNNCMYMKSVGFLAHVADIGILSCNNSLCVYILNLFRYNKDYVKLYYQKCIFNIRGSSRKQLSFGFYRFEFQASTT